MDPFLDAHRLAPLFYHLSGYPLFSMAEQAFRATTFINRLLDVGEIRPAAV
jgi:hypothetical protein